MKNNKLWYAVQHDSSDAWDTGSHNYDEAVTMLRNNGSGLIAVINEESSCCIEEIQYDDIITQYRVKAEFIDCIYGGLVSQEYIDDCQENGLAITEINHLLQEYGPEVWDQLEEI